MARMANAVSSFDLGHENCRSKVCIICFSKATRSMSINEIEIIQQYVIDGYEVSNSDFPCGICVHCHLLLSQKKKDPDFVLPTADINYEPNRPTALRSMSACSCRICEIATLNGLNAKKLTKKRGRSSSSTATPKQIEKYKVCSRCFARIYRGSNHSSISCVNSRRKKLDSII